MKNRTLFVLLLAGTLALTGCGKASTNDTEETENTNGQTVVSTIINEEEMFTDRDFRTEYDVEKAVSVTLDTDTIVCKSDAVKIKDTTITLSEEGTYVFSGTLNDGMIVVDADKSAKLQIVLNNASITSRSSAPLYILKADKVFVTLAEGSTNTLANDGTYASMDDNHIDGAVFAKQDLTFNGTGTLQITSPAGHGIVCKDDLVFTGGTYTIDSASHGLNANDSIRMTASTFTITAGKDGIHAENSDDTSLGFVYAKDGTFQISAEGDGISSGNSMQINDGTYNIVTGGGSENATKKTSDTWGDFMGGHGGGMEKPDGHKGAGGLGKPGNRDIGNTKPMSTASQTTDPEDTSTSIKGIKSAGDILIKDGTFTINSADDSVHSNASISISGGTFTVASGDDGFHADDTLTVTDGTITISESYEGLEALHLIISGGTITLTADDDGLNAAGGTDESGYGGVRDNEQFSGHDGPGMGGGGSSASNGTIQISGGTLYIKASGDGIDANGTLEITGGHLTVCGPTQGDTSTLDYDVSGTISGGTFIGTGAYQMAQSFSDSEQGVIAVSVGNQTAGTKIELKDAKGNTLLTHEPELDFAIVILSSPDIQKGETYTITVGSSSGEVEAN